MIAGESQRPSFSFTKGSACSLYLNARPASNSFAWLQTSRKGSDAHSAPRDETEWNGKTSRVQGCPTIFGDITLDAW